MVANPTVILGDYLGFLQRFLSSSAVDNPLLNVNAMATIFQLYTTLSTIALFKYLHNWRQGNSFQMQLNLNIDCWASIVEWFPFSFPI